jgi:UDP-N-acetyl-D-mannosaminuronic acid dehydrogenase
MKVCILGLGYIGLPTAALLANSSFTVRGVDVVENVVNTINRGDIHIIEPDLDTFVRAAVGSGRLVAALEPAEADVFIIAVPTPFKEDYAPDLAYVLAATRSIAPFCRAGNMVILESTSPVGTTELIAETLQEAGVDIHTLSIAYCPERVLPGHVMRELIENDRIVGGLTPAATANVCAFYSRFVTGQVLPTEARTAEMCKLTENASRDVQIAFANELSLICTKLDIDVWELIRLANHHPRVNILRPGPGVGGHCIAVDPWFIVHSAPAESRLIRTARLVNDHKPVVVEAAVRERAQDLADQTAAPITVGIYGLAFKPNIDDLRESPSRHIAEALAHSFRLEGANFRLLCAEPHVEAVEGLTLIPTDELLAIADLHVILVAHQTFSSLAFPKETTMDFCGLLA